MKKILFFVFAALLSADVFAQVSLWEDAKERRRQEIEAKFIRESPKFRSKQRAIYFNPKVGMNMSRLTNIPKGAYRYGLAAGVEAECMFTEHFSTSLGLLYSQKGSCLKDGYANSNMVYDYLEIPFMFNAYPVKNTFALKAGVQLGRLIHHSVCTTTNNGSYETTMEEVLYLEHEHVTNDKWTFGFPVGIQFMYKGITAEARYMLPITTWVHLANVYYFKDCTFQFLLGYRF